MHEKRIDVRPEKEEVTAAIGADALLRCVLPPEDANHLRVAAWITDDGLIFLPSASLPSAAAFASSPASSNPGQAQQTSQSTVGQMGTSSALTANQQQQGLSHDEELTVKSLSISLRGPKQTVGESSAAQSGPGGHVHAHHRSTGALSPSSPGQSSTHQPQPQFYGGSLNGKYIVLLSGDLLVSDIQLRDSQRRFRCLVYNQLTSTHIESQSWIRIRINSKFIVSVFDMNEIIKSLVVCLLT